MKSMSRTTQTKQVGAEVSPESGHWGQAMFRRLLDQAVLSELDRRHRAFVETLPPHLRSLARDRRTVIGKGPSSDLQTVAEIGLGLGIPWMFRDTFPGLTEEQWLDVGEAWLFLLMAIFLRDHMADDQVPASTEAKELWQRLMTKAGNVFRSLVGDDSSDFFWQRFEDYDKQVVSALQLEKDYRAWPGETYDLKKARQIGVGKGALYKAPTCAMAVLCGQVSSFPKLDESMDALAAGCQLYDDVTDWQEDLARGHYTYPLVQAIIHLKASAMPISPQTIEAEISKSTIREDALRQAKAWHQESLRAVDGIPCQDWIDLINNSLVDCISEHYRLILCRIAQAVKEKSGIVR